jgi:7-cyano-7-deazaguanine reductase
VTTSTDLDNLTHLGRGTTRPSKQLETFPNRHPDRAYTVTLATDYVPDQKIVESKSLKLYFWSYRNQGVFHEHVTNTILDDLVEALDPRWCEVVAEFGVRGGIAITVRAEHKKPASVQE